MMALSQALYQLNTSLQQELSITFQYAYSNSPSPVNELTDNEKKLHETSVNPHSFLYGRKALKLLCRKLRISEDTSLIKFPHTCISLTHDDDISIAIAMQANENYSGIGIDLERSRPLSHVHARYFLNENEMETHKNATPKLLTQLWTIKEAVFKSDIHGQEKNFKKYHLNIENNIALRDNIKFAFRSYLMDSHIISISLRENSAS